ncbi:hypothetical protein SAMN02746062_01069 [Alysiella filiformis DSM 16848]|uniref:Uncharacterized protein n=1 Tax=Alysiella filiformis DSM 16848 TaxID=1120981 RepID=A0A286EAM7_9NEIS|nr:hypothetical protein SAMN02746062_01069 [Alysiella filiformis DSM 16848]
MIFINQKMRLLNKDGVGINRHNMPFFQAAFKNRTSVGCNLLHHFPDKTWVWCNKLHPTWYPILYWIDDKKSSLNPILISFFKER